MKKAFIILGLLAANVSFGRANYYDDIMAGDILASCGAFLKKHQIERSYFDLPELRQRTLPLRDAKLGVHFYHYTNSNQVANYFLPANKDRKSAQLEISHSGNLEKIMQYSFANDTKNLAGPGFYIAGTPGSSRSYGNNQVHLELDPEARIFLDIRPSFYGYSPILGKLKTQIYSNLRSKTNDYVACNEQQLLGIALQESGVDLVYYDKENSWFSLYNEEIIVSSDILTSVSQYANLIVLFSKNDRLNEIDPNKRFKIDLPSYSEIQVLNRKASLAIIDWMMKGESYQSLAYFIGGFNWSTNSSSYPERDSDMSELILSLNQTQLSQMTPSLCYPRVKKKNILEILTKSLSKDKKKKNQMKEIERANCTN